MLVALLVGQMVALLAVRWVDWSAARLFAVYELVDLKGMK